MTKINTSWFMACLMFSSIALSGCGGSDETDPQEDLANNPTAIAGGNGFDTGNTTNIPPVATTETQGTSGENAQNTADAATVQEENPGEDASITVGADGESGSNDENPQSDTGEGEPSWEGLEGVEGAILISDVDSEFEQANIASVNGFFGSLPAAAAPVATFGDCEVTGSSQSDTVPETPSLNAGLIQFEGLLHGTHGYF